MFVEVTGEKMVGDLFGSSILNRANMRSEIWR